MSDAVKAGEGWVVSPAEYLERRPSGFGIGEPSSRYLRMRDGCRLALDLYLPHAGPRQAASSRWPAILIFTPEFLIRDIRVIRGCRLLSVYSGSFELKINRGEGYGLD